MEGDAMSQTVHGLLRPLFHFTGSTELVDFGPAQSGF